MLTGTCLLGENQRWKHVLTILGSARDDEATANEARTLLPSRVRPVCTRLLRPSFYRLPSTASPSQQLRRAHRDGGLTGNKEVLSGDEGDATDGDVCYLERPKERPGRVVPDVDRSVVETAEEQREGIYGCTKSARGFSKAHRSLGGGQGREGAQSRERE